jgi:hypothetical protein
MASELTHQTLYSAKRGLGKARTLSPFLQKPVDDGPWVRFVRTLGRRRLRRPRRLLRLRPLSYEPFRAGSPAWASPRSASRLAGDRIATKRCVRPPLSGARFG